MKKSDIKTFLFKKKIGKVGLKKIIKVIIVSLLIIYIPIALIAFISNLTTKSDNYAAILLSAHAFTNYDHWAPPIAFFGSYPAWTLYFNSKGLKTDYIFSATKKDFIDVILDEKSQSIVLVGHGSYNSWQATDGIVGNFDIECLKGKFKKKTGEWFQLSCPSSDYSPIHLGEWSWKTGNLIIIMENVLETSTLFWMHFLLFGTLKLKQKNVIGNKADYLLIRFINYG